MNKTNLVDAVANDSGLSKVDAGKAVDAIFESIIKSVAAGEDVRIPVFGAFQRVYRKARVARNPRTGESIDVPERNGVKFKAGKGFIDAVNI